jgi:hypothetical protein
MAIVSSQAARRPSFTRSNVARKPSRSPPRLHRTRASANHGLSRSRQPGSDRRRLARRASPRTRRDRRPASRHRTRPARKDAEALPPAGRPEERQPRAHGRFHSSKWSERRSSLFGLDAPKDYRITPGGSHQIPAGGDIDVPKLSTDELRELERLRVALRRAVARTTAPPHSRPANWSRSSNPQPKRSSWISSRRCLSPISPLSGGLSASR